MHLRATKSKRKRRCCGLCKPHKRGAGNGGTARGEKARLRELVDRREMRRAAQHHRAR